jgi:OOP family OmpA-OmpF porin
VYFDRLEYVASLLLKDSLCAATISGHTDHTGSAKANEIVSKKRADAVKQYLLDKGVNVNQLNILTFSNSKPVAEGTGNVADSQNRRVEIKLGVKGR